MPFFWRGNKRGGRSKDELVDEASRVVQRGRIAEAPPLLREASALDPEDVRVRLRLADVLQRLGDTGEAVVALMDSSRLYQRDGFFLKAIATLRQATRIDPGCVDAIELSIELYERLGLHPETVTMLRSLSQLYARQQRHAEALECLDRLADDDDEVFAAQLGVLAPMLRSSTQVIANFEAHALDDTPRGHRGTALFLARRHGRPLAIDVGGASSSRPMVLGGVHTVRTSNDGFVVAMDAERYAPTGDVAVALQATLAAGADRGIDLDAILAVLPLLGLAVARRDAPGFEPPHQEPGSLVISAVREGEPQVLRVVVDVHTLGVSLAPVSGDG